MLPSVLGCLSPLLLMLLSPDQQLPALASLGEPEQEKGVEHGQGNSEFQAINSYLTAFEPLHVDSNFVEPLLVEAIETINSIGSKVFHDLDPKTDDIDPKYQVLFDNNPTILLNIMQSLILPASPKDACSQEQLNFLSLAVEQQTFDGQFLNRYARHLIDQCLHRAVGIHVDKIERTIGKMNNLLFDLMADVARMWSNVDKEKETRSRGELTIRESSQVSDPVELARLLKGVSLRGVSELRQFALVLNRLFNRQLPVDAETDEPIKLSRAEQIDSLRTFYTRSLLEPCAELEERLDRVVRESQLNSYLKFVRTPSIKSLTNQARHQSVGLEQYLEIQRICEQVRSAEPRLRVQLERMR